MEDFVLALAWALPRAVVLTGIITASLLAYTGITVLGIWAGWWGEGKRTDSSGPR